MVYTGTVHNGVVVFDGGVNLPEGSPVRVELLKEAQPEEHQKGKIDDS